jgi:hypothetical protein
VANSTDDFSLAKAGAEAAGVIGAFLTVLAGFQVATGGLDRMIRDSPDWSRRAILCVTAAAVIGLFTTVFLPHHTNHQHWRQTAIGASAALFVIGLIVGIWTAIGVASVKEQPNVTAALTSSSGLSLKANVKLSGLQSTDHVQLLVNYVNDQNHLVTPAEYQSEIGPNPAGVIDSPIELTLSQSPYSRLAVTAWVSSTQVPNCNLSTNDPKMKPVIGCLVFSLPQRSSRPQLTASWEGDVNRVAVVKLTAHDVGANAVVTVRALANRGATELFAASLAADSKGDVDSTVRIPVASPTSDLCISAQTRPTVPAEKLNCPALFTPSAVWVSLTPAGAT